MTCDAIAEQRGLMVAEPDMGGPRVGTPAPSVGRYDITTEPTLQQLFADATIPSARAPLRRRDGDYIIIDRKQAGRVTGQPPWRSPLSARRPPRRSVYDTIRFSPRHRSRVS